MADWPKKKSYQEQKPEHQKRLAKESSELYQAIANHNSTYSVDDRLNVAMLYVTEGNMKKVSSITDIPYVTLDGWKRTDWWPQALQFCHRRKDQELELRFSKVIHDSVSEVHDRVVNGDWKLDKTGQKIRVPMSGRDLSVVMGVIHDKRQLLRGEATSLTVTKDSQADKLKALEQKFQEFSSQLKAKTIEGEVVE